MPNHSTHKTTPLGEPMTARCATIRDWPKLRDEAAARRYGRTDRHYRGIRPRIHSFGEQPGVEASHLYVKRIDRAEWPERIRDLAKKTLFELTDPILPNHDQGRHSNCWVQGPIRAVEIVNVLQGGTPHLLSAESVTVPIDGNRDRGGNPEDAIRQLIDFGACDQSLWPVNDFNERHANPTWKENRAKHKIIRFVDLLNFDDQITFALHTLPHVLPLNWWRHCVCGLDAIQLGAHDFGLRIDNSWGNWGDRGTKILDEESATGGKAGAWGVLLTTMEKL